MAKISSIIFSGGIGLFICLVLLFEVNGSPAEPEKKIILPQDILNVMTQDFSGFNSKDAFSRPRYFLPASNVGRDRMQAFIKYKFSYILGVAGGKEAGHVLYERPFTTAVKTPNSKVTQVSALNYLVHLAQKENNTEEDQPLVILANYDSDSGILSSGPLNPVEENGSGVAALLVLGEKLAADIHSGALVLKHSIILAAADASLLKYTSSDGIAPNATTGADEIATKFLPEFLINRPRGIRGVIVLDNLMNFQGEIQTQHTTGFDRSYPEAYREISTGNFAGDFLALVARGDELDRPLVETIHEMWNATRVAHKGPVDPAEEQGQKAGRPIPMEPRLIKFEHDPHGAQGEGYVHFLKSDQSSFWSHKSDAIKPYPAVLLTDTRSFRTPVCPENQGSCDNFDQTTSPMNLEFAHRTILAVYQTIVKLQSGGAARLSGMLTIIPMLLVAVRYFNI